MKSKIKKTFFLLFKLGLTAACLWAIYHQAIIRLNWQAVHDTLLEGFYQHRRHWLVACVLLMPVNWLLETQKWRILLNRFYPITFNSALKSVLSGITIALVTPSRTGEYFGRMTQLPLKYTIATMTATMVGSMAQWIGLLAGGIIGISYLMDSYFHWPRLVQLSFLATGLGFMLFISIIYFRIELVLAWISRIRIPVKWEKYVSNLQLGKKFSNLELGSVLVLAIGRYLVYCLQYLCMVFFLDIHPNALEALFVITAIFFIQAAVPFPPLAALAARGEIAITLFGYLGAQPFAVLVASIGLFIINLCLPALLGLTAIVGNTGKTKKVCYEKNAS